MKYWFVIGVCLSAPSVLGSDTTVEEISIENLTVVGVREPKSRNKLAGSITTIDSQQLQKQLQISDDITAVTSNLVPGMTPSRQKLSNQGENFRGRTALLLVDGIPQNNALRNGNRYAHTFSPTIIENVEVIRGASALQGVGATGGIINYVTRTAKPGDHWKSTIGTGVSSSLERDGLDQKALYRISHYESQYDFLAEYSAKKSGIYHDARGENVGMNEVQGELQDSAAQNIFLKGGGNFSDQMQRLELTINTYELESGQNYIAMPGDLESGKPGTTEKGKPVGKPVKNEANFYNLRYQHDGLPVGYLNAQFFIQNYRATYGMAEWWPTESVKEDQGVIKVEKNGIKIDYIIEDIYDTDSMLIVGLDGIEEESVQRLVHTNKNVTPHMKYSSLAPFIQGTIELTDDWYLSSGVRYETTRVHVEDSTTLYGFGMDGQHAVNIKGGNRHFSMPVFNIGLTHDILPSLSSFMSYNQGYGLPDIGRALRGQWLGNKPATSTPSGRSIKFSDMPSIEPIVTDNYEMGLDYKQNRYSIGGSIFTSRSNKGNHLKLNSSGTYDVERKKTEIYGYELEASLDPSNNSHIKALYSHVEGKIDSDQDGKVDTEMDLKNLNPDRVMTSLSYDFTDTLSTYIQHNYLFSRKKKESASGKEQVFKGYQLVDLGLNKDFNQYGRIGFAIENVFNEYYINYFSQIRNHKDYLFAGKGRTFSLNYYYDF